MLCSSCLSLLNKRSENSTESGSNLGFKNEALQMHACVYGWIAAGYRELVMQALPQISVLDGLDRLGDPSYPSLVSPCDIPGLEDYVDLLQSSDTSRNEAVISLLFRF